MNYEICNNSTDSQQLIEKKRRVVSNQRNPHEMNWRGIGSLSSEEIVEQIKQLPMQFSLTESFAQKEKGPIVKVNARLSD